ncbi:MAG: hypothetical protein OXF20_08020 [Gammaproteobacteria bacterium]|nr:hypothetical protein [Gammaproteobacteria bacterium]
MFCHRGRTGRFAPVGQEGTSPGTRAVRESPGRIAQQPWMANAQTCSQGTGLSPFGRMGILRLTKNRRFLAEATS